MTSATARTKDDLRRDLRARLAQVSPARRAGGFRRRRAKRCSLASQSGSEARTILFYAPRPDEIDLLAAAGTRRSRKARPPACRVLRVKREFTAQRALQILPAMARRESSASGNRRRIVRR